MRRPPEECYEARSGARTQNIVTSLALQDDEQMVLLETL
jgi:hypothetical protein